MYRRYTNRLTLLFDNMKHKMLFTLAKNSHKKRQNSYPYQSDLRASEATDQLASAIFDSGSKSSYEKDVGTNCANIDICPDFLIGALFAAGAAAFYVLYAAITKAGRRKKRKAEQYPLLTQVQDILYQGISPS